MRTYVRDRGGRSGVWFFSLDAASLFAVLGARASFGLPYMWSRMQVEVTGKRIHYRSDRLWPKAPAAFDCSVETGDPSPANAAGPLESFLIHRYRLYTATKFGEVEHQPYSLSRVRLLECEQTLFPLDGPPATVHYSPAVYVRIGAPYSRAV